MQGPRADPQPCAQAQRCPPRNSAFARPCFFPAPERLYCRPPVEEGLLVPARPRGGVGSLQKGPPGLRSPPPFSPVSVPGGARRKRRRRRSTSPAGVLGCVQSRERRLAVALNLRKIIPPFV